ncbi:MAG: SPOR domain-containing protein [Halioglobus sp.]|nr:SPOR domain-containing protein [Halioglobus sp.]
MAKDYAKKKQSKSTRKSPARKTQGQRHSGNSQPRGTGLRLYGAGVLTGIFLSFIGYLVTLPDPTVSTAQTEALEQPEVIVQRPRFDFYTNLTQESIDEVQELQDTVEPAADVRKPPAATELPEPYLLQAGSFRQQDDAERRRAQLLLLGLEPIIEEISNGNGIWFRVYLGPFESRELMVKARSLTTNQNIETLLLKRGGT